MTKNQKTASIIALIGIVSCLIVLCKMTTGISTNPASRLATVESLAEQGTYIIDNTKFVTTVDKVKIGDHFYSSKPPLFPTALAGVHWVVLRFGGLTFNEAPAHATILVMLIGSFLPYILLLYIFFLFCRRTIKNETAQILTFAAMSIGSLITLYASQINNHTIAALILITALYLTHKIRSGESQAQNYLAVGLLSGLLPTVDLPSGAFSACILFLLLILKERRHLWLFFVGAAIPVAVHLALTYIISGSIIPMYLRPELYSFDGSYWNNPSMMDTTSDSLPVYFFHMFFGHHGLFAMTPILLIGFIALLKNTRSKSPLRSESIALLTAICVIFVFYLLKSYNYGGVCVGMRWFIPMMPVLTLAFGREIDTPLHKRTIDGILILIAIGALHVVTSINPFQNGEWHQLFL